MAGVLAGCIELVRVMRLMFIVLSTLFILLFLLCYFFVGVLSQLRMFLRVSKVKGSLSLVGMLYLGIGVLFVVMVHVGSS